MKLSIRALIVLTVLVGSVAAQDVVPVRGGSRTEPDPKDKRRIILIAENSTVKITVTRPDKFYRKTAQMIAVYVKVENLSDAPLSVHTGSFTAIDDEKRGYSGLETEEAIKRFFDTHAGTMHMLGNPEASRAAERKVGENIRRESLASGDVPAHSFKDGLVFFEAPKKQHFEMSLTLTRISHRLFADLERTEFRGSRAA